MEPGSSLISPRAAATTAAPAPGPSACLAPSQGWEEGAPAGLETDPLLLWIRPSLWFRASGMRAHGGGHAVCPQADACPLCAL